MVISLERDEERGGKAGQYVVIGHFDDDGQLVSFTTYMHLSEIGGDLKAGSLVSAGQQIGLSGETGNAAGTPPHLHFEIRTKRRGGWVDPARELGINEEKP
jgi:murein DD-endopeptidase MepM/ murein hydrolase activator NlpD